MLTRREFVKKTGTIAAVSSLGLASTKLTSALFTPSSLPMASEILALSQSWAPGLKAAEAGREEAFSGYLPKAAFFVNLKRIDNQYDYGVVNSKMANSWAIGLNINVPIFDGLLTAGRLREARARLAKMREEQIFPLYSYG